MKFRSRVGPCYEVSPEQLRIRSGPFRWVVTRSSISRITPTRSMLSGPALSLDRLRIEYGRGKAALVSPADREAFLEALRDGQGK